MALALLLAMGQVRDALLAGVLVLFTVAVSTAQELVAKVRPDGRAARSGAPIRVIREGVELEIDRDEVVQRITRRSGAASKPSPTGTSCTPTR